MPRAYSVDLRERVVAASRPERLTQATLAQRYQVSETTAYTWLRRLPRDHRAPGAPGSGVPR